MMYVSYYTKGSYEEVIHKYLLPSLVKWKLFFYIEEIEDLGSWQVNTHFKAIFLKKMLLKYKEPIVFLDSDATIEKYPELFKTLDEYDIGLHYLDWFKFWRKQEGQDKTEALSGTLYLNYTDNTLKFLDDWIKENNQNTNWEQRNMQEVLERRKDKLKILNLPPEYCCIKLHNEEIPYHYLNFEPVILHHQISRKLKNK